MSLHPDYPIEGADLSTYQGLVDFIIAETKMNFMYIRAGSAYLGGDMADRHFKRNRAEAKGKLPRGFYFVFRPDLPIKDQMNHFLDLLDGDPGELPPALDVERNDEKLPPVSFTARLNESIDYLEQSPILKGGKVAFYSAAAFWNANVQAEKISYLQRTLWVANYHRGPSKAPQAPVLPNGWPDWTIRQLSADQNGLGKEYGAQSYSIDVNVFHGNAIDFKRWFGVPPHIPSPGIGANDPLIHPPKYVVTRTNLNIRNGPGVMHPKIGSALKLSRWPVLAIVQSPDGLWVKIAEEVFIAYWLCDPIY
jgi:GH25 family lysozyme M1 (1,4-beta-N-acetylmuramidase)